MHEGCRESLPDGTGIERIGELDGRAGKEGRQQGIDRTVDMMQGEDMKDSIVRSVLPGFQ